MWALLIGLGLLALITVLAVFGVVHRRSSAIRRREDLRPLHPNGSFSLRRAFGVLLQSSGRRSTRRTHPPWYAAPSRGPGRIVRTSSTLSLKDIDNVAADDSSDDGINSDVEDARDIEDSFGVPPSANDEPCAPSRGDALLCAVPPELWVDVLCAAGPHAVRALRVTCRQMHSHLDGACFWQSLCKRVFAPWAVALQPTSLGWELAARPGGSFFSAPQHNLGRAWRLRYLTCCRDHHTLRQAASHVGYRPPPPPAPVARRRPPAPPPPPPPDAFADGAAANGSSGDETTDETEEGPRPTAAGSGAAASCVAIDLESSGGLPSDETEDEAVGRGGGGDEASEVAALAAAASRSVLDLEISISPTELAELGASTASLHTMASLHTIGDEPSTISSYLPHLLLMACHAAELPSLRQSWGGRGPSAAQVARALMREQQPRIETLVALVARSCRTQRRLVPVWRRARVDELPEIPLPDGSGGGGSGGSGGGEDEDEDEDGGSGRIGSGRIGSCAGGRCATRSGRVRQLLSLLAHAGAGPPECWVAHLAKGGGQGAGADGLLPSTAVARTTCWMLVVSTSRHAVWLDFLMLRQEGW